MNLTRCDEEDVPCIVQKITFEEDSFLCELFNGMLYRVPLSLLLSAFVAKVPTDTDYREVEAHAENFYHYKCIQFIIQDHFSRLKV